MHIPGVIETKKNVGMNIESVAQSIMMLIRIFNNLAINNRDFVTELSIC
ncbi:hypothetical protein VSAK1_05745 [Vibrio mediterranei AK1]|nr:hypothetical protein VSAK1_05745 [Vibrio mediterranei AK1]